MLTFQHDSVRVDGKGNAIKMIGFEEDHYDLDYEEIYHTTNVTGNTHKLLKEILEGYSESDTQDSKDDFGYKK